MALKNKVWTDDEVAAVLDDRVGRLCSTRRGGPDASARLVKNRARDLGKPFPKEADTKKPIKQIFGTPRRNAG
jgi:hypothetical protein